MQKKKEKPKSKSAKSKKHKSKIKGKKKGTKRKDKKGKTLEKKIDLSICIFCCFFCFFDLLFFCFFFKKKNIRISYRGGHNCSVLDNFFSADPNIVSDFSNIIPIQVYPRHVTPTGDAFSFTEKEKNAEPTPRMALFGCFL
jgi:hypothetical protein